MPRTLDEKIQRICSRQEHGHNHGHGHHGHHGTHGDQSNPLRDLKAAKHQRMRECCNREVSVVTFKINQGNLMITSLYHTT